MRKDISNKSHDLIEREIIISQSLLEKGLESDITFYQFSGNGENSLDSTHLYEIAKNIFLLRMLRDILQNLTDMSSIDLECRSFASMDYGFAYRLYKFFGLNVLFDVFPQQQKLVVRLQKDYMFT